MRQQSLENWFKLENYSDLKNNIEEKGWICNLKLWRRQLLIRRYIKRGLEGMPTWNETDRQRRCDNAINYWLPLIKKKPIFDESYENGFLGEMRSHKLMGSFTFDQPTVMSTPSRDVYRQDFYELREKALSELTDLIREMRSVGLFSPDYLPFDYLLQAVGYDDKGQFTHVTVDLTATDGQIKEDFANWLKTYRKAIGRIPNGKLRGEKTAEKNLQYGENDLKEWLKLKLLPYIDLKLMKLAGEAIDNNTIAKLLYPDEYYHENDNSDDDKDDKTMTRLRERITDTLESKENALLSDNVIDAINMQLRLIG